MHFNEIHVLKLIIHSYVIFTIKINRWLRLCRCLWPCLGLCLEFRLKVCSELCLELCVGVANDGVITISTAIVVVWCDKASCSPARVLRQVALVHPVGRLAGCCAPANATSVCSSCGLAMQFGGRPNVRLETPAVAALQPWAAGCASWLARVTLQHAEVGIVEPVPRRFARRIGRVSWLEVLCARRVRGLVAKPQAWLARLRPLPKGAGKLLPVCRSRGKLAASLQAWL